MNFSALFDYTKQLIWEKFHVIPDHTILSLRYGFVIQWQFYTVRVFQSHIEFHMTDEFIIYRFTTMDEAIYYIELIMNSTRPYRVY